MTKCDVYIVVDIDQEILPADTSAATAAMAHSPVRCGSQHIQALETGQAWVR
ncbi:MAG: hypothetical protein ACYTFA_04820 [Planctomycetota bacterium]